MTAPKPPARRRSSSYEIAAWILLIALLAWWRWPILKGYLYRASGAAAQQSAIAWRTDLDAALAEAQKAGRPLLVDFTASWCAPCIAMKHDVWTDDNVERTVTDRFVPVMIDIDRDPATSDRFQVETIPTVLVLDASGRVLHRTGFMSAADVIALADKH